MPRATSAHGSSPCDTLLATKLYMPALRPDLVPRPRLLARLDRGLAARLILISAPAGSGKTTLIGEWLGHCACPSAWVSLDAADNDPRRFFEYVIAAIDGVVPGSGGPVRSLLDQMQALSLEAILTHWLNGLCTLDGDLVLVLDDYHLIEAKAIHAALAFVISNLPPRLHLVIATRADPLLPLARLRSRGQLLEVRGDDLRFTSEEAAAFLNQTMGLGLSAEDVAALELRTEGWIAGLQMAALSMQGREDAAAFVQAFSGSHRYVLDYLAEEVLERQPQEVQEFLLRTCILERLTASLCEAVTGRPGAQAMLERLERSNLFLVQLDDERRWYRYHHLFAGLLRARLGQVQPEAEASLQSFAAEWCERNGYADDAVRHAVAAGDIERAARLAESQADAKYTSGHCNSLLAEANRFPPALLARCPRLCVYSALRLAVHVGDVERAETLLRLAEEYARGRGFDPEARDLLGMVAAVRSTAANLAGEMARAAGLARQAWADLAEGSPLRFLVAFVMGDLLYQDGDLVDGEQKWAEARRLAEAMGSAAMVASTLRGLISVCQTGGRLNAGLSLGREVFDEAARQPQPVLQTEAAYVNIGVGQILCQRNELDDAERCALSAIHRIGPRGQPGGAFSAYTTLAQVRLARGDLAGAAAALDTAERQFTPGAVCADIKAEWMACRVRLWLAQSRQPGGPNVLAAAVRWADERRSHLDDGLGWVEELEQITVARVRLAQGRPAEAADLLARLIAPAEAGGRGGRLIEILALQALALRAEDHISQARDALARALALAESEGYVRVFLDEGAAMLALLKELRELGEWEELEGYIGRLLAYGLQPALSAPAVASIPLTEPLSARELEVLRLAAAGLSNREIAERLILAVGTVKTHLHNIYGKLGSQSRIQALARATELGLL